jgi:hypothetical protein
MLGVNRSATTAVLHPLVARDIGHDPFPSISIGKSYEPQSEFTWHQ